MLGLVITGQAVQEARTSRGLTRQQAADLLNVNLKTLATWERGNPPVSREKLIRERLFADAPTALQVSAMSDTELVGQLLLLQTELTRRWLQDRAERGPWLTSHGPPAQG